MIELNGLLAEEWADCPCGRAHGTDLRFAEIGRDALNRLPRMLAAVGIARPMLVCDRNTWDAAGRRAAALLDDANVPYRLFRFETRERLMPAEWALGSIAMRFCAARGSGNGPSAPGASPAGTESGCDGIVGVGGGVINDLCKLMGKAAGVPTAIVATAPSMDGFASNSGAMEVGGVKRTIYTPCPAGVLCDTEIMAAAPRRMLLAGVGDMIAKFVSVCDWRLSHLINGEYYCERIAGMMRDARRRVLDSLEGIAARDPEAIGVVTEGLVMAGVAMGFAGVSRPASGLEHCFSHIWEMMALERHRPYDLHGIQVGVGTMLALPVYEWMKTLKPTMERVEAAIAAFDNAAWEANLRRVFGRTAQPLIAQARAQQKNAPEGRRRRAERIIERWDDVLAILDEELPDARALRRRVTALGLPARPVDIGISERDALDAFICSRDIRDRYLSTSMLWDIGALEAGADAMLRGMER